MSPATISAADFEACLQQFFQIHPDGTCSIAATLVEVKRFKKSAGREGNTAFSALFHVTGGSVLTQNVYRVENENIGLLEIFLVPVGPDPDAGGMCYEAVFN